MSDAPKIRVCKTCVAWQKNHEGHSHINNGQCRMFPPMFVRGEGWRWPETRYENWCMQWAEDRERVVERIKEVMVEG